jgi:hypothetical protein
MKIRSITFFLDPEQPLVGNGVTQAGAFLAEASQAFEAGGYAVQTTRLATTPFCDWHPAAIPTPEALLRRVGELEGAAAAVGIAYISLGPARPETPWAYHLIPDLLAATTSAFFSGAMTDRQGNVCLPAVRACAEVIARAAPITSDGFANLRFAALANVPPGSPFFPAAYHRGEEPAFALATEAAPLAVEAFAGADSLAGGRRNLIEAIEGHARALVEVSLDLAGQFGVRFGGIDFSLAPFPEQLRSLGMAFERMGVPAVGLHGSLAAAAILADTLDQAVFPRAGFSGLFLPVLEDAVLAKRAAQGGLTVSDLLLYSAVCGTGLDTIPLPGDAIAEQLAAVLLDIAALATRLDKPLTARLMPIPGKAAGDRTDFDFDYFANSRVMGLRAAPLEGVLAGGEDFSLQARRHT